MSQILTDNSDFKPAINQTVVYALDGEDVIITSQTGLDLYGGEGSDFLGFNGTSDADIYGGAGSDTIHGGTIGDQLYGDDGSDLIVGGEFSYFAFESSGQINVFDGELSGADYLDGGEGRDALYGFDGDDILIGGEGNDSGAISAKGQSSVSDFHTVTAGLFGGAGNDYLDGGRGNDFLNGGSGNDTMVGGLGDDTFIVEEAGDVVHEFEGGGFDIIQAGISYSLPSHVEALILMGLADYSAYGNNESNGLYGNAGNNSLFGGGGIDLLDGGAGNDGYIGGADADYLRDTAGGNDTFVFTQGFGADIIEGFQAGAALGDVIVFDTANFANVGAVVAHWADVGGNVVIDAGFGNTVTILGVTTAQMSANDFAFI